MAVAQRFSVLLGLAGMLAGCLVENEDYAPPSEPKPENTYQLRDPVPVQYVIDGDTFAILRPIRDETTGEILELRPYTIRLKGINTPEREHECWDIGDCPAGQDCAYRDGDELCGFPGNDEPEPEECYQGAKEYTYAHIGNEVDLTFDSECTGNPADVSLDILFEVCVGYYGRVLAYVTLADGSDLGALLIQNGLSPAFAYQDEQYDRRTQYESLEAQAQANALGIWGPGCP